MLTTTKPLTVIVVDGNNLVRSAFASLLEIEPDVDVVAAPDNVQMATSAAAGHKPDVILFNPENKKANDVARCINNFHQASPDSAILILTDRNEPEFAKTVLNEDAGYLLFSDDTEDLFKAIERAADGVLSITPRIAIGIAQLDRNGYVLTERETKILSQIAFGYTNREIADNLFLSARTVESHRANIVKKLNADTKADLVRYAIDNNLLQLPDEDSNLEPND